MWEIVLAGQAMDVPLSLLWGMGLELLYDILRGRRRIRPDRRLTVALWDTAFGMFAAYAVYPLFLVRCNGEIRGYMLMSVGIGMWLCRHTLSKIWLPVWVWLFAGIHRSKQLLHKYYAAFYMASAQAGRTVNVFCKKVVFSVKKGLKDGVVLLYTNTVRKWKGAEIDHETNQA